MSELLRSDLEAATQALHNVVEMANEVIKGRARSTAEVIRSGDVPRGVEAVESGDPGYFVKNPDVFLAMLDIVGRYPPEKGRVTLDPQTAKTRFVKDVMTLFAAKGVPKTLPGEPTPPPAIPPTGGPK